MPCQCVNSVKYGVFHGPYFAVFGLNTEIYGVTIRIQSEYGKMWTRETLHLDTCHTVYSFSLVFIC